MFLPSIVAMVTLAGLVVVPKYAGLTHDISEPVFEAMPASR
jgi:hypothetical protein